MCSSEIIGKKIADFAVKHGLMEQRTFSEFARFVGEIYGEGIQRGLDMSKELEAQRKKRKKGNEHVK
ncbi:hypothetical protein [Acidaminococcus fermentans]|uniref:hypothetical protein n=1 Tax=Acidaminococcus fermentans TaxID=905 RepID=UPI00241E1CD8|nr:hypothetical protein [Acidaminococcus fermentans]